MARNSGNQRAFQVVQFIELPFESIDDYVCVPYTWLIVRRTDQKAVVKYPKDEDPFDTRDRAERKERYNDKWGSYMAIVKYESDTYWDAEYWIATRNDYGPLVEKESKVTDTPPRFTLNKKMRSANQNHLSKSNDNSRKSLPILSTKRPAQSESKKGIGERLKLGEAAQSSNAVINDARVEPGCLKFLTIIQDNQLMECAKAEPFNNIPDSFKMSADRYSHMLGGRRLVPIQEPVEIEKRVMQPISRNLATTAQNPSNLINQTTSLLTRSVEQQPVVTQNQPQNDPQVLKLHTENQYLPTNQGNFKQELHRGSIEGNSYDHRPTSRTIKMSISSNRKNLTHVSNPMYQTSELPQQRQSQPNQQDLQRQPQRPKIHINITIRRKDKRQIPTLQGVTKKTQRQALSTTHNNLILSQQQLQPRLCAQSTEDNNIALTTSPQSNNSVQRETQPATQSSEETHTEITASASSSNENQQGNDVSNKPPEKQHKRLWRFVLPPEYDPHNTRWTLKYETNQPGLVELLPQSRIYVSLGNLKYCQDVSNDCESLARRLLKEVFNRTALSVCLTMSEKTQVPDNVGSNIRPELDEQACTVLLNFVLEHGLQRGWNTDLKPILSTLDTKIKVIRFKYGVMIKS